MSMAIRKRFFFGKSLETIQPRCHVTGELCKSVKAFKILATPNIDLDLSTENNRSPNQQIAVHVHKFCVLTNGKLCIQVSHILFKESGSQQHRFWMFFFDNQSVASMNSSRLLTSIHKFSAPIGK